MIIEIEEASNISDEHFINEEELDSDYMNSSLDESNDKN